MQEAIQEIIQMLRYSGIFGLMLLFASEPIMPFAGFVAWSGALSLPGVILAGTCGSTLGSIVLYYVTGFVDHSQIYQIADKHGKWLGLSARAIRRSERWFDKHAIASVLFGRFLPGTRTASSLIAGYRRMPIVPFIICTFIGTGASAALLACLGYFVSDRYEELQGSITLIANVFVATLVVGSILFLYLRRKRRRTRTNAQRQDS